MRTDRSNEPEYAANDERNTDAAIRVLRTKKTRADRDNVGTSEALGYDRGEHGVLRTGGVGRPGG